MVKNGLKSQFVEDAKAGFVEKLWTCLSEDLTEEIIRRGQYGIQMTEEELLGEIRKITVGRNTCREQDPEDNHGCGVRDPYPKTCLTNPTWGSFHQVPSHPLPTRRQMWRRVLGGELLDKHLATPEETAIQEIMWQIECSNQCREL